MLFQMYMPLIFVVNRMNKLRMQQYQVKYIIIILSINFLFSVLIIIAINEDNSSYFINFVLNPLIKSSET